MVRAAAVASGLLVAVFTLAKPYAYSLPRSVVVFDFLLTIVLLGGARLARRMVAERPDRATRRAPHPRGAGRRRRARAGRWWSASCG